MDQTFYDLCCRHFGCKPEACEDAIFWHCLFSQSKLKARLMHALHPEFFLADRKLIRSLAGVASYAELENELMEFRVDYISGGFLREKWRMRVSTTKIARLGAVVFQCDSPKIGVSARPAEKHKTSQKSF